jgi:hypothetical protein
MECPRHIGAFPGLNRPIPFYPGHSLLLQLKEVYELLSANYVEDEQAAFRFRYTAEFLEWYAK